MPGLVEHISEVRSALGGIKGVTVIRKELTVAQRVLRNKVPKPDVARKSIAGALELSRFEIDWRTRASAKLGPQLAAYESAITDTIGLRGQSRLPDHVAVEVAACSAVPRDIFFRF